MEGWDSADNQSPDSQVNDRLQDTRLKTSFGGNAVAGSATPWYIEGGETISEKELGALAGYQDGQDAWVSASTKSDRSELISSDQRLKWAGVETSAGYSSSTTGATVTTPAPTASGRRERADSLSLPRPGIRLPPDALVARAAKGTFKHPMLCVFTRSGTTCTHGDTCGYAHSCAELQSWTSRLVNISAASTQEPNRQQSIAAQRVGKPKSARNTGSSHDGSVGQKKLDHLPKTAVRPVPQSLERAIAGGSSVQPQMCKLVRGGRECPRGNQCDFAHSSEEVHCWKKLLFQGSEALPIDIAADTTNGATATDLMSPLQIAKERQEVERKRQQLQKEHEETCKALDDRYELEEAKLQLFLASRSQLDRVLTRTIRMRCKIYEREITEELYQNANKPEPRTGFRSDTKTFPSRKDRREKVSDGDRKNVRCRTQNGMLPVTSSSIPPGFTYSEDGWD